MGKDLTFEKRPYIQYIRDSQAPIVEGEDAMPPVKHQPFRDVKVRSHGYEALPKSSEIGDLSETGSLRVIIDQKTQTGPDSDPLCLAAEGEIAVPVILWKFLLVPGKVVIFQDRSGYKCPHPRQPVAFEKFLVSAGVIIHTIPAPFFIEIASYGPDLVILFPDNDPGADDRIGRGGIQKDSFYFQKIIICGSDIIIP